ncbi:hypothetical protein ACJX0J_035578 [Zea mays]
MPMSISISTASPQAWTCPSKLLNNEEIATNMYTLNPTNYAHLKYKVPLFFLREKELHISGHTLGAWDAAGVIDVFKKQELVYITSWQPTVFRSIKLGPNHSRREHVLWYLMLGLVDVMMLYLKACLFASLPELWDILLVGLDVAMEYQLSD